MPFATSALSLRLVAIAIEFLSLDGADDADLVVLDAVLAAGVDDRVDVQARGAGLSGELAESLHELFLEVVVKIVLFAEEDDAAAGDSCVLVGSMVRAGASYR